MKEMGKLKRMAISSYINLLNNAGYSAEFYTKYSRKRDIPLIILPRAERTKIKINTNGMNSKESFINEMKNGKRNIL